MFKLSTQLTRSVSFEMIHDMDTGLPLNTPQQTTSQDSSRQEIIKTGPERPYFNYVHIILGLLVLVAVGVGGYMYGKMNRSDVEPDTTLRTEQTVTPMVTTTNKMEDVGDKTTNIAVTPTSVSTNEKQSWKVYTNTSYNLTFQYPDTWEVRDLAPVQESRPVFIGYGPKNIKEDVFGIIEISSLPMSEVMAQHKLNFQQNSVVQFVTENPIQVSGIDGREVVYLNTGNNLDWKTWFVAYQGYTYTISGGSSEEPLVAEIASTIQLIK